MGYGSNKLFFLWAVRGERGDVEMKMEARRGGLGCEVQDGNNCCVVLIGESGAGCGRYHKPILLAYSLILRHGNMSQFVENTGGKPHRCQRREETSVE